MSKGDKSVPAAVFDLPVMKASDPVKNTFGNWVIVRATSVTPGTLKTLEEAREEIRKAIPLGRIAEVEDIAPSFVFLASDAGRHYQGQCISPNGGDVFL